MKTNEEKMDEELTKLYNNYTKEREQIKKKPKKKDYGFMEDWIQINICLKRQELE